MSYFSLSKFQTEVRTRGVAKQNRFEVFINTPAKILENARFRNINLVSLFCESASLPPIGIGVKQQRIYGPAYQRPSTIDYGGDGMAMTFLMDQQMDIKAFFDCWMAIVINPVNYNVNYQSDYVTDIGIYQLNEKNETTYSILLTDAFPKSYNLLEVNNSSQNSLHKLSVNFVYRKAIPNHAGGLNDKLYPYDTIRNGSMIDTEATPAESATGNFNRLTKQAF
jgi:hypothetical protein